MNEYLQKYSDVVNYLNNFKRELLEENCIDLEYEIVSFLKLKKWNEDCELFASELEKKIEVSRKYFDIYTKDWKKDKKSQVVSSFMSSVATLFLYISFKELQKSDFPYGKQFKRLNAILKGLDVSKEEWVKELNKDIYNDMEYLFNKLPIKNTIPINEVQITFKEERTNIKEVLLTVLYYEGPIARAYLQIFKLLNIKPKKIIHMVSSIDIATKKPIGRFLPKKLRTKYAAYIQESKINYWPKQILKQHPEIFQTISKEIEKKLNIPYEMLEQTTKELDLSEFCNDIEEILVTGLKDPLLLKRLNEKKEGAILYTGGGIVPPSLLEIEQTRFLHIHPGFLPFIRGADCTLWSSMLYSKMSASCFYMSPGIDTGEIILPRWMPNLFFNINVSKYDQKTLYRAIYGYLDPWIRASILRELLQSHDEFMGIDSIEQNEKEGYTYYFMHDKIKEHALYKTLKGEN